MTPYGIRLVRYDWLLLGPRRQWDQSCANLSCTAETKHAAAHMSSKRNRLDTGVSISLPTQTN